MASGVSAALRITNRIIGSHKRNLCLSSVRFTQTEDAKGSKFDQGETHFGFETVKEDEKASKGRLRLRDPRTERFVSTSCSF